MISVSVKVELASAFFELEACDELNDKAELELFSATLAFDETEDELLLAGVLETLLFTELAFALLELTAGVVSLFWVAELDVTAKLLFETLDWFAFTDAELLFWVAELELTASLLFEAIALLELLASFTCDCCKLLLDVCACSFCWTLFWLFETELTESADTEFVIPASNNVTPKKTIGATTQFFPDLYILNLFFLSDMLLLQKILTQLQLYHFLN